MELLFGVSNFGKIKHAEIILSNFTLFVGDNNSGKTFMMQLLYGVLKELGNMEPVLNGIEECGEKELVYGAEWINNVEEQVNVFLQENKEKIVRRIFHKGIEIGELYFHLVNVNEKYICEINDHKTNEFIDEKRENIAKLTRTMAEIFAMDVNDDSRKRRGRMYWVYHPNRKDLKQSLAGVVWEIVLNARNRVNEDLLFLPASRTGLQLLSKYFFAERDKRAISEISVLNFEDEDGDESKDIAGNELGLTAPVYDFLQFLVRYNQRPEITPRNKELLRFIEHHLIDGQVKHVGDEIYYHPDALTEDKEDIPLYLASSLVNEITPIIKALSGAHNYRYIFYDEVETCLHPLKQGEMARLIIRLVNSGKRMIVSTHSDTMAGKLNNLLLLSFSEEPAEIRDKKLEELGLSTEDLLADAKVHVYQFVNQADGSSSVEELKFQKVPYVGYDFNLFTRNLDELYHETDIILK